MKLRMKVLVWKSIFKQRFSTLLLFFIFIPGLQQPPADQSIEVTRNEAETDFPTSITFHLSAQSDVTIESVELNYGIEVLSCAEMITRAVPANFTPGKVVILAWEWDMYQSGSIPTGTTVWWQWVLIDKNGQRIETEVETLRFEDTNHNWQIAQSNNINLYYYEGGAGFGRELVNAGEAALLTIEDLLGYELDSPVQVFIYATPQDMRDATLYLTEWTGGYAMPEYGLLIIAVGTDELAWGRSTMAHELSHIVVGRMAFSCVSDIPRWLDEGLALTVEGRYNIGAEQFQEALDTNSLLRIRQIEGAFSGDDDTAVLSYAQSLSITSFLIEEYGSDLIRELLEALKAGNTTDEALTSVYGFDRTGLEVLWRDSIGAPPIDDEDLDTEATPTRTPYPTIAPLGAAATEAPAEPELSTPTPTITVTAEADTNSQPEAITPTAGQESGSSFPIKGVRTGGIVLFLGLIGLIVLALIGGGVLLILHSQKRR